MSSFRVPKIARGARQYKNKQNLLLKESSSKGANQEVMLTTHPEVRRARSAPYGGEGTSKLGEYIYTLSGYSPPKLGQIRADAENL